MSSRRLLNDQPVLCPFDEQHAALESFHRSADLASK